MSWYAEVSLIKPLTDTLRSRLRSAVKLLRNRNMPLSRLEGEVGSGKALILISDQSPAAETLGRSLFSGEVIRTNLKTVPLWDLNSRLQTADGMPDLSIVHVGKLEAERFFKADCLRIPDTISVFLKTPENIESLWRSNHSLKSDMRLVKRAGMVMKVEGPETDFGTFYHRFYLPFINDRHGELAYAREEEWLKDRLLDGGAMIWIERGGEKIAGSLVQVIGEVLHCWVAGTRDGDLALMKAGAVSATYLSEIEYAQRQGCKYINFGLCQASLRDGVLLYKRKWGTEMRPTPDNSGYFLIRWPSWNQNVAAFFAANPLVHEGPQGLTVITATTLSRIAGQDDVDQIHRALFMPGIHTYIFVNGEGWQTGTVPPADTKLVDGAPLASELIGIS